MEFQEMISKNLLKFINFHKNLAYSTSFCLKLTTHSPDRIKFNQQTPHFCNKNRKLKKTIALAKANPEILCQFGEAQQIWLIQSRPHKQEEEVFWQTNARGICLN
jgi:hypothetical protein